MAGKDRDTKAVRVGAPDAPATASSSAEIAAFLADTAGLARRVEGARLIFALDATASREPTWDRAMVLQAEMFEEAARSGDLAVQLVYYRGQGECRAARWAADAGTLRDLMARIECRAGATQVARVLAHAAAEARDRPVAGLVFVGDALEEAAGEIVDRAGALALLGVPCFLFQEGHDRAVADVFAEVARLTGGAHVPFDAGAAAALGRLLRAVAAYATGGRGALEALADRPEGEGARLLLTRMQR